MCSAARWRRSDSSSWRSSRPTTPPQMMPAAPIARARVSASMSSRAPATMIAPAAPMSTAEARSSASGDATPITSWPLTGWPQPTSAASANPVARRSSAPASIEATVPSTGEVTIETWRPSATRSRPSGPWNRNRARSPGLGPWDPPPPSRWAASITSPGFSEAHAGRLGTSVTTVSRQRSRSGWPTSTLAPTSTRARSATWMRSATNGLRTGWVAGATNRCGATSGTASAPDPLRPARPVDADRIRRWRGVAGRSPTISSPPSATSPGPAPRPLLMAAGSPRWGAPSSRRVLAVAPPARAVAAGSRACPRAGLQGHR